ncbi:uncharacterized protein METZ01_LOCUS222857 [marine metagenome]|uniref:Uncharacterized protein n=1 Tax=marine metagenome TaxID=408172 RepID=A0A382G5Z7_9ZZZZ
MDPQIIQKIILKFLKRNQIFIYLTMKKIKDYQQHEIPV